MKTKSKELVGLAQDLYRIIQQRKELERQESMLKDLVKNLMGNERVLEAGNIVIAMQDIIRKEIDRSKLLFDHGLEFMDKYSKIIKYKKIEVTKIESDSQNENI